MFRSAEEILRLVPSIDVVEAPDDVTDRIRAAALELFTEASYGTTNVEQIASGAGVGVASLYRRWPDKAALANDLLASALDGLTDIYRPIEASRPKDRFMVLWQRVHTFVLANPRAFLFLEEGTTSFMSPENRERKAALSAEADELLASAGIRASTEVAGAMVVGTLVSLLRDGIDPDVDDLGERLWQALRTPAR